GSIGRQADDGRPNDRTSAAHPVGMPAHGKIPVENAETLRAAIRAGLEAAATDGNGSEGDEGAPGRAVAR
ncbi:MAG TPA: hypothetical protein VNH40_01260, partial [Gaiellaceae bacterium]|nr:hypothetical protein [Gaiellaceae bacterium]